MKLLFMVDKYYPDSSANTICCDNLIEYFKKKNCQVDIVTIKWNIEDKDYDIYKNSNIIKLNTYWIKVLTKKYPKYSAKRWKDLPWYVRKPISFLQKIKYIFRPYKTNFISLDCLNYDDVYKTIVKINHHYDALFTFTMPAAFQVIGYELMKRKIADRWYPIFLDAYVYNETLSKSGIGYRKKLMCSVLKKATHIFMVDGIKGENLKKNYNPEYLNKTTEIFIPMIKKIDINSEKNKDKKTHLLYAGIFYKDIRNPEIMLKILSKLPSNCVVDLYSQCCEDIVNQQVHLFKECQLNINKIIPHDECVLKISQADFLINLGNTITNQMPSKIFEYISFGKPIINFYFNQDDMCLPILEKYPLSININVNNYNENDIDRLINFINEYKNKKMNFNEATKDLINYRSDIVAEKIYEVIINSGK